MTASPSDSSTGEHTPTNSPSSHSMQDSPSAIKKPATTPASRAWMIGGILLLFILIVGVLVFTKLQAHPSGGNPNGETPAVQVKLLIDEKCLYCFKTNTILAKLDESHIHYDLTTYDISSSDEGKALAKEFNVEYVPTALINLKGLDQNSEIQRALQGQNITNPFIIIKGWVVVPEKFLDQQPRLLTFLKPPQTKTIPPEKISLLAQLDYGNCSVCSQAFVRIQELTQKYPQLDVTFVPILYNRSTTAELVGAINANKGAVCADKLGYLTQYSMCAFFNATFQGNIDINYMKSCAREAGMGVELLRNQFVPCVQDQNSGAESTLVNNTLTMHAWNPLKYSPSFVIDYKYAFVGHGSLESYICSLHPELTNCPTLNVDQNALSVQDINAPPRPSIPPGGLVDINHTRDQNVDTNAH